MSFDIIWAGPIYSAMPRFRMIEFHHLPDDHNDLSYSPLLRAALLTLQYVEQNGPIALTKTKAFRRTYVRWAAERFDWPGMSDEELSKVNKVLNETDFPPLELLHFLLIELKLGRHYKAEFRLTKRGKVLAQHPGLLFETLIPFYVLNMDHSSYSRLQEQPFGTWDIWLNVLNIEIDQGAKEQDMFRVFYDEDANWGNANWRALAAFSSCVIQPLEWAGLIGGQETEVGDRRDMHYFKTPLWRAALKLDLDDQLKPLQQH
jgi:hypothetical protein